MEIQGGTSVSNRKDVEKNLRMLEAFSLDHERRVRSKMIGRVFKKSCNKT